MKLTPQQKSSLTPLAHWLLSYVRERDMTLTELSRQAGLALGALRSLVIYPDRTPSLETCLRLAKITDRPNHEIIQLAGLKTAGDEQSLDPDRIDLLRAYDNLHDPHLRRTLTTLGRLLLQGQQG